MPRSISKFIMVTVAIGVTIVGASAFGIAAAHSSHEQAKATTHRIMFPQNIFNNDAHCLPYGQHWCWSLVFPSCSGPAAARCR